MVSCPLPTATTWGPAAFYFHRYRLNMAVDHRLNQAIKETEQKKGEHRERENSGYCQDVGLSQQEVFISQPVTKAGDWDPRVAPSLSPGDFLSTKSRILS